MLPFDPALREVRVQRTRRGTHPDIVGYPHTLEAGILSSVTVMTNTKTVQDLLGTYADALSRVDLDAIAGCYHYPALAVTRLGCQAITDEEMTKEFFEKNSDQYKERGVDAMRFGNVRATYDEDGDRAWIA